MNNTNTQKEKGHTEQFTKGCLHKPLKLCHGD